MWLMTRHGFVSAVAHSGSDAHVLVRARLKSHLVAVRKAGKLGGRILSTPKADYPWRMTVRADRWAKAVARFALEVDYPNFKAEVVATVGKEDPYVGFLLETWWQSREMRPGQRFVRLK